MKRLSLLLGLVLIGVALVVMVSPGQAHEHRPVGKYTITFGWRVEPAYVGQLNGPGIEIVEAAAPHEDEAAEGDHEEGEAADHHDEGTPVSGLEDSLTLEVSFGPTSRVLTLSEAFGQPGFYTADLIPTRPGDYSFHLTGTIGDTAIDETFTSSAGLFSSVEPSSDIYFPDTDLPTILELQAQIDELRALIEAMQNQ